MAKLKTNIFIMKEDDADKERHRLLKEFVKSRNAAFTKFYGETSRYNIGNAPREQDKPEDTVFIILQNEQDKVVGGARLSLATTKNVNILPIASGTYREDGKPSTITLDTSSCPGNTTIIELSSVFSNPPADYKGQKIGPIATEAAVKYVKKNWEKSPYILLAETVPVSTEIIKKCFIDSAATQIYNSIDNEGEKYIRSNVKSKIKVDGKLIEIDHTDLAVQAITNLSPDKFDLKNSIKLINPEKEVLVSTTLADISTAGTASQVKRSTSPS